jgi:hypothetical protein
LQVWQLPAAWQVAQGWSHARQTPLSRKKPATQPVQTPSRQPVHSSGQLLQLSEAKKDPALHDWQVVAEVHVAQLAAQLKQ